MHRQKRTLKNGGLYLISRCAAKTDHWNRRDLFDQLFALISPHLLLLFPSVRQAVANNMPLGNVPDADDIDQPVWQFLAILATQAAVEQQQTLVVAVKERVLESVTSATKGLGVTNEEQRNKRLANVNIFLHALGLDSSQITL